MPRAIHHSPAPWSGAFFPEVVGEARMKWARIFPRTYYSARGKIQKSSSRVVGPVGRALRARLRHVCLGSLESGAAWLVLGPRRFALSQGVVDVFSSMQL